MPNKFDVDPDLIRKLSDLLGETGLSEIEYESSGRRIRVARNATGNAPVNTVAVPVAAPGGTTAAETASEAVPEQRRGTAITSPMVGTVFVSPEPGADPFIRVGDTITEGQTVMLNEAMKT